MSDRSTEKYEQQKARSRDWKKRNPERHAELARAYRRRNKDKIRAQNKLNYAIRKGRMVRGCCGKCGTNERVQAHHHDYSKPYDVEWVCQDCHKKYHHSDENLTDEHKQVKFEGAQKARLFGEDNPMVNISLDDIRKIKVLLDTGEFSQNRIASMVGVSQSLVSAINLGKHWSSK